jgi:hypothetical protein
MRGSSDVCRKLAVALAASIGALGMSGASHAQGAPPAPPPDVPVITPPAEPPVPAAPPPAVVAVAAPVEAPRIESDFNVEERRWAIGYAGFSNVPTGAGSITVPAVGLRYWLSPSTGVDVALGINWTDGSTDAAGMTTDKNALFGVLFSGGVPFVLSAHRHVSFEVVPYLTVGYGRTSTGTPGYYGAQTDFNGVRLDVGARAGVELFFGFIGIPELALSATVGAQFEYLRNGASTAGVDSSDTTYSLSTTVQSSPWDIFAGNVAARYYF